MTKKRNFVGCALSMAYAPSKAGLDKIGSKINTPQGLC